MNFIDGKATFAGGTFNTNNIDNVAYVTVAVSNENKDKVQIEEGNVATDYVPHEEYEQVTCLKEPLRGLNGVYDELDYSKGQIIRRFAKYVFDGVNNKIVGKSNTTYNNMFSTNVISNLKKPNSNGEKTNLMCTHFNAEYTANQMHLYGHTGIASRTDGVFTLGFGLDSEINTVELANAFLAEQYANGTPVEVVYELATPIIEHLDCFDKIKQFDGQTTIFNTDEAELECTLTNNVAIAQINQNLQKIEEMIASLKAGE